MLGGAQIERHAPAKEEGRVEIAEQQVGVGDRRPHAAPAVARRTRVGARAVWPNFQQSETIDARNRAAARANLDQIHNRDLHRQPAALLESILAVDFELRRGHRLAVFDDAQLGRRATHVEGQQVADARELAVVRTGQRPPGADSAAERKPAGGLDR